MTAPRVPSAAADRDDLVVAAPIGLTRMARVGAVVWPSFFAACVASMVFFAIVDPHELAAITWPHLELSRKLGYSIGFFMFWLCTLSACSFTALLSAPPRRLRQTRRDRA